ncbi:hypothetical protein B0O95_103109 [Mycetohabitans endofungorum]|uniref:Uncharacterized protein n=1 Tax=Mycetohabitans endofungorum TaxID=417203 RepID=A0A2P5KCK3_9BURK|nr:hypothetical protein B0O95_103109 [Mycetohabitans endofungorum]
MDSLAGGYAKRCLGSAVGSPGWLVMVSLLAKAYITG